MDTEILKNKPVPLVVPRVQILRAFHGFKPGSVFDSPPRVETLPQISLESLLAISKEPVHPHFVSVEVANAYVYREAIRYEIGAPLAFDLIKEVQGLVAFRGFSAFAFHALVDSRNATTIGHCAYRSMMLQKLDRDFKHEAAPSQYVLNVFEEAELIPLGEEIIKRLCPNQEPRSGIVQLKHPYLRDQVVNLRLRDSHSNNSPSCPILDAAYLLVLGVATDNARRITIINEEYVQQRVQVRAVLQQISGQLTFPNTDILYERSGSSTGPPLYTPAKIKKFNPWFADRFSLFHPRNTTGLGSLMSKEHPRDLRDS